MPGKLHIAAANDAFKELVRLVEEEKLDVNDSDENKIYPLEYAVINHRIDNVNYLLTKAKVDLTKTPHLLEKALRLNHESFIYSLVDQFFDKGLITELSRDFYISYFENVIDMLNNHPEKILEKDKLGRSLFYWIGIKGDEEFKEIILQHKAFTKLSDEERDELLRDLAKGVIKRFEYNHGTDDPFANPFISYFALLKISKYKDEDHRAFAHLRSKFIRNIPGSIIQHLEKIKSPTKDDYFNLADAYIKLGETEKSKKSFDVAKFYLEKSGESHPGYFYQLARIYKSLSELDESSDIKKAIDELKQSISYLNRCTSADMTLYPDYFKIMLSYCEELGAYIKRDSCENLENHISIAQLGDVAAADRAAYLLSTGPKKNLKKALQYYAELGRDYQDLYNRCRNELLDAVNDNNLMEFTKLITQDSYPLDDDIKRLILNALCVIEPEKMPVQTKQEFMALILPTKQDVPPGVPQWFYQFSHGENPSTLLAEIQKTAHFNPQQITEVKSVEQNEDSEEETQKIVDEKIITTLTKASFDASAKLLTECKKLIMESETLAYGTPNAQEIKKDKNQLALQYFDKACELGFPPGEISFSDKLKSIDLRRAWIAYLHNQKYSEQSMILSECYSAYLQAIEAGDLDAIQVLLDDKQYPFKENAKHLISVIIDNAKLTAITKCEMLYLFISRGMECPLTLPLIEFFDNAKVEIAKRVTDTTETLKGFLAKDLALMVRSYAFHAASFFQKPCESKSSKTVGSKSCVFELRG